MLREKHSSLRISPNQVVEANRRFYDQIATVYDSVDTRRHGAIDHAWLDEVLRDLFGILRQTRGESLETLRFLDAGAGSGFLSVRAKPFFGNLLMVDVSSAMLRRISLSGAEKICGECAQLPVRNASVDVVGAFATLHHLRRPEDLFREAHRVLRPGGLFYSDHDLEGAFASRFRLPLKLHRAFFDHGHAYLKRCPSAASEDYTLSEFHGERGLEGPALTDQLAGLGFSILREVYHWEGMGKIADLLRGVGLHRLLTRRGWAPIVRIIAVKNGA